MKKKSQPKAKIVNKNEETEQRTGEQAEASRTVRKVIPRKTETIVRKLVKNMQTKLDEMGTKPSITDLIRLLQFQQELEKQTPPRAVEVKWVEPAEEGSSTET